MHVACERRSVHVACAKRSVEACPRWRADGTQARASTGWRPSPARSSRRLQARPSTTCRMAPPGNARPGRPREHLSGAGGRRLEHARLRFRRQRRVDGRHVQRAAAGALRRSLPAARARTLHPAPPGTPARAPAPPPVAPARPASRLSWRPRASADTGRLPARPRRLPALPCCVGGESACSRRGLLPGPWASKRRRTAPR